MSNLRDDEGASLEAAGANQLAADRVLGSFGSAYGRTHQREVAVGAVRKVWVVLSAEVSPAQSGRAGAAYRLVYLARISSRSSVD